MHVFAVSDAISGLDQQLPVGVVVDPAFERGTGSEDEDGEDVDEDALDSESMEQASGKADLQSRH